MRAGLKLSFLKAFIYKCFLIASYLYNYIFIKSICTNVCDSFLDIELFYTNYVCEKVNIDILFTFDIMELYLPYEYKMANFNALVDYG